jgi:hypothetical protein
VIVIGELNPVRGDDPPLDPSKTYWTPSLPGTGEVKLKVVPELGQTQTDTGKLERE